ncbi:MAG: bifunctional [glutamate--ammonia ligase]-adenylyl-L-tyrosine phosphorylase/[glutamate--ammonia-ligase] adenylyltransferase [Desulfotignum sp.]|nr:bifunctional [glutamate--ammonia ligase]-adenylyl-L-tyrosine phosphorylase/[glutamate--ammonia-ligase] adenylyltransferase [Desulfotignum sp.]
MDEKKKISMIETVFPALSVSLKNLLITRLERFYAAVETCGQKMDSFCVNPADLIRVLLFSDFVADSLAKNPAMLHDLADSGDLETKRNSGWYQKTAIQKTTSVDTDQAKKILIDFKCREIIRIAWRDLTGNAELTETLSDLSELASASVNQALDVLYEKLCITHGIPMDQHGHPQQMVVLGMGKLGAKELNFSSDIDLIFVYPKEGNTFLDGRINTSNLDFFTRLCKQFLKFFASDSGQHFYRVDTRLRPFGDSGPLVMSADAFEEYFQTQGREWERYAMIKAAPVAGDLAAGRLVLHNLNGFIYRRYFDYGSFDSFRDMKQRITLQVKNARLKNNIKLGAGGIREIEFFGQLFQLIRGGVEPSLQAPGILQVLHQLAGHDCINAATRDDLIQSYRFLRTVENRLQEYQDLQTHDIPDHPDQRMILALAMGFDDYGLFKEKLNQIMACVHGHFSQLLVTDADEARDPAARELKEMWLNINDPQFSQEAIEVAGFEDPGRVLSVLRSLAGHPNTLRLTPAGRKKLARLVPVLLRKAGQAKDSEAVLVRLVDLIITIERRTTYLSLLIENFQALNTLITLAEKSPWIITFLASHPVLLDELMHPASLYALPKKAALEKEMAVRMAKIDPHDQEYLLEELNIFRQVNTLRVAAADVSGNYPLMKVSDHLTYIAETVLTRILQIAWHIVSTRYGFPPQLTGNGIDDCGFAIVAYGKVGGLEMGYKSDLDLVFLYQGEHGDTHGGERSIETVRFYGNLGQRIIHALTMHTPAGTLYGADMRLRPGGDAGMIVSHIEAFEEYMENQAWTWEHQALIRARPITGDRSLMDRFDEIRQKILCRSRPAEELKQAVREMRERMRRQKLKSDTGMFDLKQGSGGIVDIEFLVQYLTLRHGADHPDVTVWTDNVRLLEGLSCEGLISGEESGTLQKAYITLRQGVHRLTLQEKPLQVPAARFKGMTDAVKGIYDRRLGVPGASG